MIKKKQKGFAAIFIAIIVLVIFFTIVTSISLLSFNQQIIAGETNKSTQSYYAAEAGIEDALLRISKKMPFQNNYEMTINNSEININISNIFGGARTITAYGKTSDNVRKVRAVYAISTESVSFFYGAQIGEGGIEMLDNSSIVGNVFSNGDIIRISGNPKITGNVIISGENNHLTRVQVLGNLNADICNNATINGILTSRINNGCSGHSKYQNLTEEIDPIPLPISDDQIKKWEVEAEKGGIRESLTISGGNHNLGPIKINGDLFVTGNTNLFITGTVWVTGRITISGGNRTQVRLSEAAYGSTSGVIVTNGQINLAGSPTVTGTGRPGSFLMLLTKFDSSINGSMAVQSRDTPNVDIIYAPKGRVHFIDRLRLKEIIAWGLRLENSTEIVYDFGLINTIFSSGTGGTSEVIEWLEIK